LVLLYRPEYTHHWASRSYYTHIGVTQLSVKSQCGTGSIHFSRGEASPELKELILTRAAGNPLFMEEFTCTF